MKQNLHEVIKKLERKLFILSGTYLSDSFKEEQDVSDIINVLISAYVSALSNCLDFFTQGSPEINLRMTEFSKEMINFLKNVPEIKDIKRI